MLESGVLGLGNDKSILYSPDTYPKRLITRVVDQNVFLLKPYPNSIVNRTNISSFIKPKQLRNLVACRDEYVLLAQVCFVRRWNPFFIPQVYRALHLLDSNVIRFWQYSNRALCQKTIWTSRQIRLQITLPSYLMDNAMAYPIILPKMDSWFLLIFHNWRFPS